MRNVWRAAAGAAALAGAAHAQSVDYEGLAFAFGEPVTLAATGTPKRASQTPSNVTIITADEIARSGARDLPDLLNRFVGIQSVTGAADAPEVAVRGYVQGLSRQLLVLVDGREHYNAFLPSVYWSALPVTLDDIQQIEIVRGPAVAQFGLNAASGAVNIVTKAPGGAPSGAVAARAGGAGVLETFGVARGALGRHGFSLSGRASRSDAFDDRALPEAFLDEVEDPDSGFAALRSAHDLTPRLRLETETTVARLTETHTFINGNFGVDYTRFTAKAAATWEVGPFVLSADAVYERAEQEAQATDAPGADVATVFRFDNDYVRGRLGGIWNSDRFGVWRGSLEYRRSAQPASFSFAADTAADTYSAALSWDRRLTEWAALNLAGRADVRRFSYEGDLPFPVRGNASGERTFAVFAANAGLILTPTAQDTVKLLFGRGHVAPSLYDSAAVQVFSPGVPGFFPPTAASSNPELEPTRVHSVEANYVRAFPPWDLTVTAAAYAKFYDQVIDDGGLDTPVRTTPEGVVVTTVENIGRSRAYGLEAEAVGRPTAWLSWRVNYAYLMIEDDFRSTAFGQDIPRTTTDPETGAEIPAVDSLFFQDGAPKHEVNAILEGRWRRFSGNLVAAYRTEYRRPRSNRFAVAPEDYRFVAIDDQAVLGGRLAYELVDGLVASIQVNEALEDRLPETGVQQAERRWFAELRYVW